MVQPILKKFTALETVVQEFHFLFCNILDIFAPWPENGAQVDLPSTRYVDRADCDFLVILPCIT